MRTITILFILSTMLAGCMQKNEQVLLDKVYDRHKVDAGDVYKQAVRGEGEVYYYYLPDWEIYYYVPSSQWIYYDGRKWMYSEQPPSWFTPGPMVYKVDLDYSGQTPFMYHMQNKQKYPAHTQNTAGPRYNPNATAKNVSYPNK